MRTIFFFLFLGTFHLLSGQVVDTSDPQLIQNWINDMKGIPLEEAKNKIDGSPYLSEDFQIGTVKTITGGEFSNIQLRYNIYKNYVEFLKDEKLYILEFGAPLQEAIISGTTLKYIKGTGYQGGYGVLYEGDHLSAYQKMIVRYNEEKLGNGIVPDIKANFSRLPDEFLIIHSDGQHEVITSKKELKAFGKGKEKILATPKKLDAEKVLAYIKGLDEKM